MSDRTAVGLRVGHGLTETGLAFLQDARARGDMWRPLNRMPEVHHPLGGSEAVIPDALLYYRRGREGDEGVMLRAFVEVDRATMGPERLAAKLAAYARLHSYTPQPVGLRPSPSAVQELAREEWRRSYPCCTGCCSYLIATTLEKWPQGWRVVRDEPQGKKC